MSIGANFFYWREILPDKLTLRRQIKVAQQGVADAYEADRDNTRKPIEYLDDFEDAALSIRQQLTVGSGDEVDNDGMTLQILYESRAADTALKDKHGFDTKFKDLYWQRTTPRLPP